MSEKSVVIDIDGVLADFEGAFCQKFGWENRWLVSLEKRYPECEEEIGWFVNAPITYERLDILDLGIKIARFCENENFKIHMVSSRPRATETVTRQWLKQNKIPYNYMSIGYLNKLMVIEKLNPLFIVDDLYRVVDECSNVGIPSFLIDHPWNQEENLDGIIYRIRNFDEFLGKFIRFFDV